MSIKVPFLLSKIIIFLMQIPLIIFLGYIYFAIGITLAIVFFFMIESELGSFSEGAIFAVVATLFWFYWMVYLLGGWGEIEEFQDYYEG